MAARAIAVHTGYETSIVTYQVMAAMKRPKPHGQQLRRLLRSRDAAPTELLECVKQL